MALQEAFENLTEREQRLVGLLGVIFALMIIALPLFLLVSSISDIETENAAIRRTLRDLRREQPRIAAREAQRSANAARYRQKAPPLGSFVEAQAQGQGLTVREVNDQPDKVIGNFRRRHVRASLRRVELRPAIKLLHAIENSEYPVGLERLQIENVRSGQGFDVQFGVIAYEASEEEGDSEAEEESSMASSMRRRRSGPPSP